MITTGLELVLRIWVPSLWIGALLWTSAAAASGDARRADGEAGARAAMTAFMQVFNSKDEAAWTDSLVFPHVRFASGTVVVYPDREAFMQGTDMENFARDNNWGHSTWDDIKLIQSGANRVHFTVTFSRYRPNGEVYATFDSLYVVERVDGNDVSGRGRVLHPKVSLIDSLPTN